MTAQANAFQMRILLLIMQQAFHLFRPVILLFPSSHEVKWVSFFKILKYTVRAKSATMVKNESLIFVLSRG